MNAACFETIGFSFSTNEETRVITPILRIISIVYRFNNGFSERRNYFIKQLERRKELVDVELHNDLSEIEFYNDYLFPIMLPDKLRSSQINRFYNPPIETTPIPVVFPIDHWPREEKDEEEEDEERKNSFAWANISHFLVETFPHYFYSPSNDEPYLK